MATIITCDLCKTRLVMKHAADASAAASAINNRFEHIHPWPSHKRHEHLCKDCYDKLAEGINQAVMKTYNKIKEELNEN